MAFTSAPFRIYRTAIRFLAVAACFAAPLQSLSAEQVKVISVSDGDTVVLHIGQRKERVRLIGIDTPESHDNRRARKQSERNHQDIGSILEQGRIAAQFTRKLLPQGMTAKIEYDTERRDHYGRLLAYLWLPNGEMVNETIIRSGYAYPLTIPPNVRYRDRFLKAFSEARSSKRGLWAR